MNLEAVILDVDGTLVDSERDGHRVAFNAALAEFGLPWRWEVEEYGRLLAVTGGQSRLHAYLAEQGVSEEDRADLVPRLHRRKTELFIDLVVAGEVPARPGVVRFLDEVAGAGLRLAVATTGSLEWVEPLLDRHFGPDRFEVVVGGDDVEKTKPDPAVYLVALDRLGLEAGAALAVEDSVPGLGAARNAGVACVVVTNGYTRGQDFTGAALVLDGFEGLDVATLGSLSGAGAGGG
ncbi:MAG: HAD-IA family hydrolase [Acidimicrobiia bacterium]